jgi:hypothetical protein
MGEATGASGTHGGRSAPRPARAVAVVPLSVAKPPFCVVVCGRPYTTPIVCGPGRAVHVNAFAPSIPQILSEFSEMILYRTFTAAHR